MPHLIIEHSGNLQGRVDLLALVTQIHSAALATGRHSRIRRAAVAIDGEIYNDPLLEAVEPDSEVHFLPRVGGG